MRLLTRFVSIPQNYETYLSTFLIGIIWPIVIIYISFSIYYMNNYPISFNHVPWDVPAICLFALFFAPNRFRTMCFFAIILVLFEHSYRIENCASLIFYSIFGILIYITLTLRRGLSYSFFTLMSAFLSLYSISLFLYWMLSHATNAPILFDHILSVWLNIFMIYPLCFSLFHILLIKRYRRPHHNAL